MTALVLAILAVLALALLVVLALLRANGRDPDEPRSVTRTIPPPPAVVGRLWPCAEPADDGEVER